MRIPYVIGATAVVAAGLIACSPDSMCGCPPEKPASVFLRGVLSDAQGSPMPRVVVVIKAASDTVVGRPDPFFRVITTDSTGTFRGEMYWSEEGARLIRFLVVPPSTTDTVLAESRLVNFSKSGPVTVDVNLRLNR